MSALDKFVEATEKLLGGNLLTSVKDIRDYLIMLSSEKELREVLTAAGEGFKFEEEFRRAFADKLKLPTIDNKVVSLVSSTLYYIDTGALSLTDLLTRLYGDKYDAQSYTQFLLDLIQPFAESFVRLLTGEPMEEIAADVAANDKLDEDVTALIKEMTERIDKSSVTADASACVRRALAAIDYTLSFHDAILTRNAYLGYLDIARIFNVNTGLENDLNRLLRLYGVL